MRLHRLCVTAFGPFAGTQEVDFDALGTGGLFLFTGATGAGKTSLLDAVCFALYGQVPGARQQARALRSDHAADGLPPAVVLEATLRGRRLRVTRTPAWERPKRRGAGTVTENAKVVLEEAGPDGWSTLSTRLDEAGQLLGELTGLSLAQFCQVVLLPQGQFAEFLRADADRRRELLETLFDTRRFASVEAWLVARRQDAARCVDELDQRLGQVLARVGEAAGTEVPDGVSPDDAAGWVERLLAEARSAADSAAADAVGASARADEAASRLAAARRDDELRRRHAALEARVAGLGAQTPARDAAVAELDAARAVAPLVPLMRDAARLQTDLEQARARAAGARTLVAAAGTAGLAATGTDHGGGLPPARAVGTASQAARDEATGLRTVLEQEREIDALVRSADSMARRAVQASAVAAKAAEWLAGAPERRAALATARDAAKAAADSAGALAAARDTAAAQSAAGERRDALRDTVADARDVLRACTDRHQRAVDRLQAVRADRLAGMAAELAAGLAAGDDCPVCGSAEHPRPARTVAARVTAAAEEAAGAQAAEAEQARRDAADALARAELDLVVARTAAGGDVAVAELATRLAAASAAAARARALAARLPAAESALADFDRQREQWTREQVAQDAEAVHLAARVGDQQVRVAELLDVVGRARGGDPSVAARVERLGRLATDLQRLAEELAELERLEVAAADALDRAEAGVRSRRLASLDSLEAVSRAVRDDDQVAGLELLVRRHDAALAAAREQLADAELSAAAARQPADVAAAEAAAAGAASVRDSSLSHAAAAAARVVALERLQGALDATLRERAPLARRHALVDGLSRLAEGKSTDNRLRMSLSAYVLAARLEQVAASASERLLRMSSGRFILLHTADGGPGRARGGLALRVLDAWTGRERDPGTLSGGESFSASLALALGLADVVTSEAGGAVLETLFVDEGFGSLDDDTLDEVMGVLDDLRDGGRTVGLVSHVADLRQRIPVQLRVEKGRDGSVVRQ